MRERMWLANMQPMPTWLAQLFLDLRAAAPFGCVNYVIGIIEHFEATQYSFIAVTDLEFRIRKLFHSHRTIQINDIFSFPIVRLLRWIRMNGERIAAQHASQDSD